MGYSGAILRNKEGKILFQLRDKNGRNPNKWGDFWWWHKKNETPEQAVIRELKEELGIVTSRSDFIKEHNIPIVNYHIFQIKLRKIPKKSDLREGKRMKLMTKEEFFKTKNALLRVKIFLKIFE